MHFKLNPYALAFTSLFLVACSGGKGSFDLEDVQPNKTTSVSKEEYQDVETDKKVKEQLGELMEPALGYVVKVPVSQSGARRTEISNPEAITDEDLNKIPNHETIKSVADQNYGWVVDKTADKTMKYVRSGYAIDVDHYGTRDKGYVFYKGITPSKELPQGPVLTYQGEWDFTSDANLDAKRPNSNPEFNGYGPGQRIATTSANAKGRTYTSEFEVDFSTKKLKGKLNSKTANAESLERYSIEAELKGNRFRGKAIAKDTSDAILGKSSDYLEGGFYGPKAEELAGKFITNDKSLFAVFSAKHNGSNVDTVRIIDASKIDLTHFNSSELTNFGDASVLIIDGKKMDLAGTDFKNSKTIEINGKTMVAVACCSNLEYMKFGQLWQKEGETAKDNSLFLQGERTTTDKMPKGGNYKYIGTWDALVSKGTNWIAEADNNRESGYRSEFDVNFGDKKVSGKLFDKGGVNPVFTVDAKINGNGFTGKAKTSDTGFALDSGSSRYDNVKFSDVAVNGGFYGPTAAELGGQFFHKSDNGSVGAVFGAKQQVKK
ncbi:transferrin-binding protein-like solute binding protein [Glaesserella parasuis]|uniref:Transferrin-binding protein-like solute binding protein n=1 Tax=Glaesserella parasuis TaxID=738 RepID=A0AAX1M665_GLAPU|nr:transferrin-binding protein-like solute binding protein [Glaesserella parasuis]MDG6254200.1 transferrin-binding protein-like solute binding protein [Glaesserella parasuis]MDG6759988.1 transferrin-binding protein-like solute binding protein [Glaesserella parasuis]MDO9921217.1 transferrin-binding protein-like solute binding protein [Glaesserella parasuis]MDO9942710.1 transferrin-binding protein-like solute binding protein [Glaesserella parasuis]MDO9998177.1 transferrin-binding protein-like so